MTGRIDSLLRRLGWHHLVWIFVLAGITYVCLPFFYAGHYTWRLLHPICQNSELNDLQGDWVKIDDEKAGSFQYFYMPPENNKVIILIGGRAGLVSDWQYEINAFIEEGYGLAVLPDPGCNLQTASLGVQEADQIIAIMNDLADDEEVDWVGAAGFSAGASALALAVPQTDILQNVVLMGNFADLESEIMYTPYKVWSVGWLGQRAVPFWYWLYTGNRVRDVSPIEVYAGYSGLDVLLIHGENEAKRTQAGLQFAVLLSNDAVNAELWIVPGAYHGMYYETARDGYLNRLVAFFEVVGE